MTDTLCWLHSSRYSPAVHLSRFSWRRNVLVRCVLPDVPTLLQRREGCHGVDRLYPRWSHPVLRSVKLHSWRQP